MLRLCLAVLFAAVLMGHAEAAWPPKAPDLSITVSRATKTCLPADDCRVNMRIENLGSAGYDGPLTLAVDLTSAAVPGPQDASGWECRKLTYTRLSCAAKSFTLPPAGVANLVITFRLLPTPRSEMKACLSFGWTGPGTPAFAALKDALGTAQKDRKLFPAVFGQWGTGDLRSANDSGCVSVAIGYNDRETPACSAGQLLRDGECAEASAQCTGGRSFDVAKKDCACPAGESFDPSLRQCAAPVQLSCSGGRTASPDSACICTADAPLWNPKTEACEALASPQHAETQPVVQTVTQTVPPAPAAPSYRRKPPRTASVCINNCAPKMKHVAPPRKPRPQAHRTKAAPRAAKPVAAVHRKCPALLVYNPRRDYCWPWWIIDPDVIANGPYTTKKR
ncbi:hypothetical protein [Aestuariivirga sp.]|uniref:hypothetical protein n=1 Tax=Aestuariivirga sp. TaxID=2650926 RepID=UPI0039E4148B